MLIVDVSAIKLPGEAKQNNLPPECGQPIDGVDFSCCAFEWRKAGCKCTGTPHFVSLYNWQNQQYLGRISNTLANSWWNE
jgi:hypothetical protein